MAATTSSRQSSCEKLADSWRLESLIMLRLHLSVGFLKPSGLVRNEDSADASTLAPLLASPSVMSCGSSTRRLRLCSTFFGSEVFPSKVLDQIGREAGVQFIATLRDDDLPGTPGSPQHSYIGMMLEDVHTIATALGGHAASLEGIDPADIP